MSEAKLDDLTLDEAIDARSALLALQRSDGWAILCKLWQQDLLQQSNAFGGPIKSEFELYAQEWTKGAVAQIKSDLALPAMLVDSLNVQIDMQTGNKETKDASPTDNPEELDGTDEFGGAPVA